jgi:hypothetical protein
VGEVPASLSRLTGLTQLCLDRLELRGEAQAAALGSLGALRDLQLFLSVPPSISRLTALTSLYFSCCDPSRADMDIEEPHLLTDGSASLAAISGCTSLVCLRLLLVSGCALPADFTRLQQLTRLDTSGGGPELPTDVICGLPALKVLDSDWPFLDPAALERLEGRGVEVHMVGQSEDYDYDDEDDAAYALGMGMGPYGYMDTEFMQAHALAMEYDVDDAGYHMHDGYSDASFDSDGNPPYHPF